MVVLLRLQSKQIRWSHRLIRNDVKHVVMVAIDAVDLPMATFDSRVERVTEEKMATACSSVVD